MDPAEELEVSDEERAVLARLLPESDTPFVIRAGQKDVRLPPGVSRVVRRLLDRLAAGEAVQLVSADAELTTREAAELLGISRTYLVRLIDEGRVAAHMVGSHRRLKASDVLAYRREREERLSRVAAIAEADADLGIPY